MRSPRRAYTLFQLLVLLAVILLLIGMLLPAVQRVREAAARMSSANNMKQIGLALHNYHDAQGNMPAGIDGKDFSMLAKILPYIEQENLYKLVDFTKSVTDPDNAKAKAMALKTYLNPQDPVTEVVAKSGATNYLGVAGSKTTLDTNDGSFYENSALKLTSYTDGTSNTAWVSENLKGDGSKKAVTVARQHVQLKKADLKGLKETAGVQDFKDDMNIVGTRGSSWMDGRFLQATMAFNRKLNDKQPDVDCGGAGGYSGPRSLGQGVNVGFADGSVRFVSDQVKLDVWKALATRDGGEVIPNDL